MDSFVKIFFLACCIHYRRCQMEASFDYIGTRIISQLKRLGLKQADLCRDTGLSTTAISQYCTGKRVPDSSALYKLARSLNTSMEWLLTGANATNEDLTTESIVCDGIPLSGSEVDLIAMYRLISDTDKQTIFDFTKLKYEQSTGEKISIYSTYTDEEKGLKKSGPASGGNSAAGLA